MAKFFRRLMHPATHIVVVQIAWTVALVFWILFFIRRYYQVVELARSTGQRPQDLVSWAPLVVGIVLLALIFVATLALILILSRQYIVNRQMRIFLSFVSHELRTPITSVRLLLETIRDNDLPREQQNEFIDNMLQDTDRLTWRIGSILDASRLERRQLPTRKQILSLDHLVTNFADERRLMIESGGRKLVTDDLEPVNIEADRDQIGAVLENLVSNAERYSPGGSDISVSVRAVGKWAELIVKDRGKGIDPKQRRKIFRLFYRAEGSEEARKRGSGLGLYIVHGIVQNHRGKVSVTGRDDGPGSAFVVRLPLAASKDKKQ